MPSTERITITLPADLADALRRTVATGEYASESEVVSEALGDWSRRREAERQEADALREAVRAGDESGASIAAEEVFAELRSIVAGRRGRA